MLCLRVFLFHYWLCWESRAEGERSRMEEAVGECQSPGYRPVGLIELLFKFLDL